MGYIRSGNPREGRGRSAAVESGGHARRQKSLKNSWKEL